MPNDKRSALTRALGLSRNDNRSNPQRKRASSISLPTRTTATPTPPSGSNSTPALFNSTSDSNSSALPISDFRADASSSPSANDRSARSNESTTTLSTLTSFNTNGSVSPLSRANALPNLPIPPSPPLMSPLSYPSSMSLPSETSPMASLNGNGQGPSHIGFDTSPRHSRPSSFKGISNRKERGKSGRAHNLFSNAPRRPPQLPPPSPAPPIPTYDSIQVVAHRPEDIAAVRSSLAQLQLTWSLYRELGRPSNLADALERQIAALASSVDRLADLPPFTITVPTQR